jgi:RNA polymerase sigma factor (sigma-70 family)
VANQRLHSTAAQLSRLLTDRQVGHCTDQQLLQRFVATREEPAFAALVERHGPMALAVCRSVLGHAQDAEDVCQATFLALARNAASVRKPNSLAHWLHGVARRLALRARAARTRRDDQRDVKRSATTPLDELTGRELQRILHEELAHLPESYRLPLILCYLEGQTRDEAARQLGWSVTTVKGRVDRGRDLLRRRLQRRGLEPGLALLVASLREGSAERTLPRELAGQTTRSAVQLLAGQSLEGNASRVAALAEGWGRVALTLRLKAVATLAFSTVLLGVGVGLAAYTAREADPPIAGQDDRPAQSNAEAKPAAPGPRTDRRGDPLPDGAVVRFGSARLRHGAVIWASALSPDGKTLATAGDREVIVWSLDTGRPVRHFRCDYGTTYVRPGLCFSPDGSRLGYARGALFACVWDLKTGKELSRFVRGENEQDRHWQGCCRFSGDGKEIVLVSRTAVETMDVESGVQTGFLAVKYARYLSPDGMSFFRPDGEATLCVGDVRTGTESMRLAVTARCDGGEDGLAVSPDGKRLALVDRPKEIQVREMAGGKVLASFPLPEDATRLKTETFPQTVLQYRVAFSTDGETLLLGTIGGIVHRWDIAARKELQPLSRHHCTVAGTHTLPDGRTLVSTGQDGTIRRWDLATGRQHVEPESYEGRSKAAYSPDGRFVAVGDARGRVDLWDGRDGKLLRTLQQDGAEVAYVAFSPDGTSLAVSEPLGTVRFWQVPSGRPGEVWPPKPGRGELFYSGLHFSPDGRLLCVNDYPRRIRVIEVAGGKQLWQGDGLSFAEAFSPDGTTLLVARRDRHLDVLDAATGRQRSAPRVKLNNSDRNGNFYQLAYSPDGRRLALAYEGTLMICDGRTCEETRHLAGEEDPRSFADRIMAPKQMNRILAIAFSPDGKWLAAAGSDTDVYVWEAATGKEVLRLPGHGAEVSSVAFAPDGKRVFSYGLDGQGYLWDLKPNQPAGPPAALSQLWDDLAGPDVAKAYRATWALSEAPYALDFMRKKLPVVVVPEKDRVRRLIDDLNGDRFEVREAASRALAELAELAVPALEAASKTLASAEQGKRLGDLLARLKDRSTPQQILRTRAVQVAELAGTAEARQTLQEWARGAPDAGLTQEARAALGRLDQRKK